jgi:hypothetical protein
MRSPFLDAAVARAWRAPTVISPTGGSVQTLAARLSAIAIALASHDSPGDDRTAARDATAVATDEP